MNNLLQETLVRVKSKLLELHYLTNTGHIGGNFSCIDALVVLHHHTMQEDDKFILSKGHSAAALYTTLWSLGKISDEDLSTFSKNGTRLGGHPSDLSLSDVIFSTGSLGHGPSLASGLAYGLKVKKSESRVFCVCSDGEWQEGSCWEALIFSAHQRLNNLTIIIDLNKLQGFGSTSEVASFEELQYKMESFGARVERFNGHDIESLIRGLSVQDSEKPMVLLLDTVKGNGLHFEGKLESHYLPINEEQYQDALSRLSVKEAK
ncbi:transketolase [Vibrio hepatarius]|uniref:transketolase n=1 Tax=Vibrio hepatarius TaxID=171383 RepID=UPI00142E50EE|nr:1-deoxy-D-xylulose-5-phosphate synthase N-terminal domain-containing protein [Vibrio hepatarius]NIY83295.1 transketolase [Vibrio hepatarius]